MELIRKYFPELSPGQLQQFNILLTLLPELNEKVNVISRKDIDHLEERHILHSLAIARAHPLTGSGKVIDAGTGGGFPGLPLAILYPETEFLLTDSIGKKIKLVNILTRELGLTNVRAIQSRVESLNEKARIVVTRAVAPLPKLYVWTRKLIRAEQGGLGGLIALKGGDLHKELAPFGNRVSISPVSVHFEEPFFSSKMIVYLKI